MRLGADSASDTKDGALRPRPLVRDRDDDQRKAAMVALVLFNTRWLWERLVVPIA